MISKTIKMMKIRLQKLVYPLMVQGNDSSFNGVVAVISMENGEALRRLCKGFKVAVNFPMSDPQKFDLWKAHTLV